MFTITHSETTPVGYKDMAQSRGGVVTKLVATGVKLHPGLAAMLPSTSTIVTELVPLTSVGECHTYHLYVAGYTVEQFVAIATAYANADFDEAARLTNELRPTFSPDSYNG